MNISPNSSSSSIDDEQCTESKRENQQRKLTKLHPRTISRIINDKPLKKDTFVHYKNSNYGTLNKRPCIRSRCNICPLSTVDYIPRDQKGPRLNVARRAPILRPEPARSDSSLSFKAPKSPTAKQYKKLSRDRKRK